MKDEIIDNIKADLLYCYEDSYSTKEEYERELDYITNLQEENRQTKLLKERYQLEKEDYKSRIDKAIEYIKHSIDNPQPFYEYLFGDENGKVENLDKLLNILQGSDKDE